MAEDLEQMWRDLAPVGRSATSGGYFRQPFTAAEGELRAWFAEQAAARGLVVEADGNGTLLATWGTGGDAVLVGSHLDSVLDGGAYDGPLGVVSAFAAVDRLRERGVVPTRPVVVAAFAEEEGSRFGVACLGSRLATGATTPAAARELRDRSGSPLLDAMSAAGLEPRPGPADWLARVGCFVELHVEQGRDLVHRDAAVGLASEIWPHGRWRFDFAGEANHAGATRMQDRRDPMLSYAATALAAADAAGTTGPRATFGRLDVAPNGTNAVPSRVTAWLDARAGSDAALAALVAEIGRAGEARATGDGTALTVTPESVSGAVRFDAPLTDRLARVLGPWGGPGAVPVVPSLAGHDAGVLAAAGVPTAMLFVRNPTGVSHSPAEHAELADCLAGVDALAAVLEELVA
ncbi:allantoate amidohydrolase [Nocardioides aurantiacus]|uniref:allantoate amidohydrolase n=1 Tax=Nocardioides aurantiacus TaxID=86796 RepID=UPI00403F3073